MLGSPAQNAATAAAVHLAKSGCWYFRIAFSHVSKGAAFEWPLHGSVKTFGAESRPKTYIPGTLHFLPTARIAAGNRSVSQSCSVDHPVSTHAARTSVNADSTREIQSTLRKLAEKHAFVMADLQKSFDELTRALDLQPPQPLPKTGMRSGGREDAPSIDHELLSIVHKGRRCFLGNTIPFRLMVKLVGRPNRYFRYAELLSEIWEGVRTDAAVRSVVKVLRSKLRQAELHELASALDGSVPGHYGLMLEKIAT